MYINFINNKKKNTDVTTVLLVDNNNRAAHGRFLNVKPAVGLLTSTARTFIQEGVTTEYATQVLGTTLDDGRLYAQLLTKSSRVLYDKDNSKAFQHNDIKANLNWQIDEENPSLFIKNTDFIEPNQAYLVFPTRGHHTIEKQYNYYDQSEKDVVTASHIPEIHENKTVRTSKSSSSSSSSSSNQQKNIVKPDKVQPNENLSTFTIKNEFSPSGFSVDETNYEDDSEMIINSTNDEMKDQRLGKMLYRGGVPTQDLKSLTSVTYYGFADFTTLVGDTVIVFSPSTSAPNNLGQVTKITGEATLLDTIVTTVKTFMSYTPDMMTETVKGHVLHMATTLPTMIVDTTTETMDYDEPTTTIDDETTIDDLDETTTPSNDEIFDNSIIFSSETVQPSETTNLSRMLSTPSNEDISKIFASLASAKAAAEQQQTTETTEITSTLGGATTIFFDDDPFDIEPTTVQLSTATTTTTTNDPMEFETSTIQSSSTTTDDQIEIETTESIDETTIIDDTTTELIDDTTTVETSTNEEICPVKVAVTSFKTFTYLTTYFIPLEGTGTTTSVKSNEEVTSTVTYEENTNCIKPTTTIEQMVTNVIEKPEVDDRIEEPTTIIDETTTTFSTPPLEIVTEKRHVTESTTTDDETTTFIATTPTTDDEIELIYKTLYTTYTYLTTFFHESTSSISSRKEVVTNVVTSTLDQLLLSSDEAVADLVASMTLISPTNTHGVGRPTTTFSIQESDFNNIFNDEPTISDQSTQLTDNDDLRTYYTTYTYFTTIFVDGETEISSRTEVYTNYVGADTIQPSITETSTVLMTNFDDESIIDNNIIKYSTMIRNMNDGKSLSEDSVITMVTDVRSSSSDGERKIIENEANQLLDDQISSESNHEEIMPAPTLLLQTSYTTFTYFTTMYIGSTSSNILSRLETITNVVTETLKPTQQLNLDDSSLPITYFTTFTYWTTLFKDGNTITTSREETISNIVQPTTETINPTTIQSIETSTTIVEPTTIELATTIQSTTITTDEPVTTIDDPTAKTDDPIATIDGSPTTIESITPTTTVDDPTTYYTTYTYFTTSYIGDETVLNSRFETVTNVVESTMLLSGQQIGRAINLTNNLNSLDDNSIKPFKKPVQKNELTTASINYGKIVDADGISTLYYTTKAINSYINDFLTQIVESTSSIKVDEIKKAQQPSTVEPTTRSHKTGLVRLIDGTIVQNKTTTLYQSKVIGTVIDGRYAQIIESTSSFLIEKTIDPTIQPSTIVEVLQTLAPTPTVIESSITEDLDDEIDDETDENYDDDDGSRKKSRLTFSTRKRTFTPVIRPFASRNRPTFNPKRKSLSPSSATIITRSDFTPTITATPALKTELTSRGRFSSRRNNSPSIPSSSTISGSSRRFSGPRRSSSAISSSRLRSSGRIQPTGTSNFIGSSSSRRGSSLSSIRPLNSRFGRVRPTATNSLNTNTVTTTSDDDFTAYTTDESLIDETTDEQIDVTTNSLLNRFRRPPIGRSQLTTTARPLHTTTRRQSILQRSRATQSPVSTTTTTVRSRNRPYQRPAIQNRPRPAGTSNNLFPPRGLFRQQTTTPPPVNQDDESTTDEEEEYDETTDDLKIRRKRQIEYGTRSPRFRRPTINSRSSKQIEVIEDEEPVTTRPRSQSRYQTRSRTTQSTSQPKQLSNNRIKPTPHQRSQFTLREKDTTTNRSNNFRRPTTGKKPATTNRRNPLTGQTITRPKPGRRNYSNQATESRSNSRSRNNSNTNRRTSNNSRQRSRVQDNFDNGYIQPSFDGTITVTHHIPTEVTIPVVNGKLTEYKNILTAKISTEILGPKQYSTSLRQDGQPITLIATESTSINNNGNTEITQFVLHETATTSVIFTPTTIRGRKTSYSHVIPSTIYDVEQVVQTVQPQISANAPLANILLSQLLLGNLNQNINPLLALQGQQQQQQQLQQTTPITEFKVRTTTYVTTVTSETSTIVPLTFRGKEILTTIVDTSVNVITATEFLTDTIVVQPTALQQQQQPQQFNSLLLPLLLQQQSQQQLQIPIQLPQQQQQLLDDQSLIDDSKASARFNLDSGLRGENDDFLSLEQDDYEDDQPVTKKSNFKPRYQQQHKNIKPLETEIITLYVSGRRPGEFSTILSTVITGQDSNVRKRETGEYIEIKSSKIIKSLNDFSILSPATNDLVDIESSHATFTESLESIIGDVSKYYTENSDLIKSTAAIDSQIKKTNYFLE